jgi:hypothetical protein
MKKNRESKISTLEEYLYPKPIQQNDELTLESLLSPDPNSKIMLVSYVPFGYSFYPEDAFDGLVKVSDALNIKRWVVSDFLYHHKFKTLEDNNSTKAIERGEIKLLSDRVKEIANRIIKERKGITESYAYLLAKAEIARESLKNLKNVERIDYLFSEENDVKNVKIVYENLLAEEYRRISQERRRRKYEIERKIEELKAKKVPKNSAEKKEIDEEINNLKEEKKNLALSYTKIKKEINESDLRKRAYEEYKSLLKSLHPKLFVVEGKSWDESGCIDEIICGKRVSIKPDQINEGIKENIFGKFRRKVETYLLRKVKENIFDVYISLGKYATYATSYLRHDDRLDVYSAFISTPSFEDYDELDKLVRKHNIVKHQSAERTLKRVHPSSGALLLEFKNPISDFVSQPIRFWFRLNDLRYYKDKTEEEIRKTKLASIIATSCWHGGSGTSKISNARPKGYAYMDFEVTDLLHRFKLDLFAYMGDAVKGTNYPESATETSGKIPQEFLEKTIPKLKKLVELGDKNKRKEVVEELEGDIIEHVYSRNITNLDDQLEIFLYYFRKFAERYVEYSLKSLSERIEKGELKGRVPDWEFLKLILIAGNHFHHTLVKDSSGLAPGKSESREIYRDLRGMVEEKIKKYNLDKYGLSVDNIMKAPLAEYVGYHDMYFYGHRVLMKHKFGVGQEGWSSFNPLNALVNFFREGVTARPIDVAIGAHYHYDFDGGIGDSFVVIVAGQEESNAYSKDPLGKGKFFAPAHFGPHYIAIPRNGPHTGPIVSWFISSDLIRHEYLKKNPEYEKLFKRLEETSEYIEI